MNLILVNIIILLLLPLTLQIANIPGSFLGGGCDLTFSDPTAPNDPCIRASPLELTFYNNRRTDDQ
jgi:hypothetical protein